MADCPDNRTPALLLTLDDQADEVAIETADEFVAVVCIRRYLSDAGGDPAAAYYAHKLRPGVTRLALLEEIRNTPSLLTSILDDHLTADAVADWAARSPDRVAQLTAIESVRQHRDRPSTADIAQALREVNEVDADVWQAVVNLLPSLLDVETQQAILNLITEKESGRVAAAEVIGARIAERIHDARVAVSEYEALLSQTASTETDLQEFIQHHPWMIGLDYVAVRPKHGIPRGQLDFVLERYDGFHDLLELKSPQDPIVISPPPSDGIPPPANEYRLSPGLANALAQVHVYREILTTAADLIEKQFGLRQSRNPRLLIVIGKGAALSDDRRDVLEQLNLSLQRVEIMPYDILGRRAEGWLRNVEHYLASQPRGSA